MSLTAMDLKAGDILECVADCPTFEADVKEWCKNSKKALIWFKSEGDKVKRCQVRI
jgi:TusA-related sulfurtransferase